MMKLEIMIVRMPGKNAGIKGIALFINFLFKIMLIEIIIIDTINVINKEAINIEKTSFFEK